MDGVFSGKRKKRPREDELRPRIWRATWNTSGCGFFQQNPILDAEVVSSGREGSKNFREGRHPIESDWVWFASEMFRGKLQGLNNGSSWIFPASSVQTWLKMCARASSRISADPSPSTTCIIYWNCWIMLNPKIRTLAKLYSNRFMKNIENQVYIWTILNLNIDVAPKNVSGELNRSIKS